MNIENILQLDELFLAQKMFALTNRYIVTDTSNNVLLYSKQKMFKLKEDFRFYFDESEKEEALVIKAQNILDFSGKYDVIDPATNTVVGVIKREGLSSLIRGKWQILKPDLTTIAEVQEDSTVLALLRRFVDLVDLILPVEFKVMTGQTLLGSIQKKRAVFRDRYYMDFRADINKTLDRRLILALAVLLDSINHQ